MKLKHLLFLMILVVLSSTLSAEDIEFQTIPRQVPVSPAFAILGINPVPVTPLSAQELVAQIAQHYEGSNTQYPSQISIEFTPLLLLKPNATLRELDANRLFYRLNASFATSPDGDSGTKAAFGVRYRFRDSSDPALREGYKAYKAIAESLHDSAKLFDEAVTQIAYEEAMTEQAVRTRYYRDKEFSKMVDERVDQLKQTSPYNQDMVTFLNQTEATKLEVAFAFSGLSHDQQVKSTKMHGFQVWGVASQTFAQGDISALMNQTSYELILSPSYRYDANDGDPFHSIQVPLRGVWGIIERRFWVDAIYEYSTEQEENYFSGLLGVYNRINKNIGIELKFGLKHNITSDITTIITGFNLPLNK